MNRREQRALNKTSKIIQAMAKDDREKTIQAMASASGVEGINFDVAMSSLLDGSKITTVSGTQNLYTNYSVQTTELYKKYNGGSDYGCPQVRAIIDLRSSFLAGEGLSVALGRGATPQVKAFFDAFIKKNLLDIRLSNLVKETELSGYAITLLLKSRITEGLNKGIPLFRLFGEGPNYYEPELDQYDTTKVRKILKLKKDSKEKEVVLTSNFVYFRTGSLGSFWGTPTTKAGIVLTECENYDRAAKEMRELNYKASRITPDFEVENSTDVQKVKKELIANKWKIGQARIGTGKFSYKVPDTGAHETRIKEMATAIKTISSVTGLPVHWLGWVDLMSNRATAEELYTLIKVATDVERAIIQEKLYEVFILAQTMYIDSGYSGDMTAVFTDFEVKLPIIDTVRFKSMIEAYQKLYLDGAISLFTYRNNVPNIDPLFEERQLEEETNQAMVSMTDLLGDEENV